MPVVTASVHIAAPPEAVGVVLLDAEAAPLWTADLVRLELIEGKVGEPGSVGHAHYGRGKRSYVLEDRLVSVDPNRRYLSQIVGGGLTANVETTLERTGDGTNMTITWTGAGTNPTTRLALSLMKRRIARRIRQDLDALCALVEARWHGGANELPQP